MLKKPGVGGPGEHRLAPVHAPLVPVVPLHPPGAVVPTAVLPDWLQPDEELVLPQAGNGVPENAAWAVPTATE